MSDTKCTCWEVMDSKLAEKGLRLKTSLQALQFPQCNVVYTLPLERLDGAKIKRGDAATLAMSHCPFCGTKYEVKA